MQDRSIDNALLALRKQIIRDSLDGLDHVEALLQMRGVAPPKGKPKPANAARKGGMASMILDALRECPMTLTELVAWISPKRPDVSPERLYYRTASALTQLRIKGLVRREGRVWGLDPTIKSNTV